MICKESFQLEIIQKLEKEKSARPLSFFYGIPEEKH